MKTQQFVNAVRKNPGIDLSVFSASFLKKTLERMMQENNVDSADAYHDILVSDDKVLKNFVNSLHLNYSTFFRNSVDMALLEDHAVPGLVNLKKKSRSPSVRIWSAGCAAGQEAYSLAMIADKVISERDCDVQVMTFGTDILPEAIAGACWGKYDLSAVLNVKLAYLDRYFKVQRTGYSVSDSIRSQVDFSVGDIIDLAFTSPPAGIYADFDIVSCCNLLIYYQDEIRQLILEKLYLSLCHNGLLLVGESERSLVQKFGRFELLYPMGDIFIKK